MLDRSPMRPANKDANWRENGRTAAAVMMLNRAWAWASWTPGSADVRTSSSEKGSVNGRTAAAPSVLNTILAHARALASLPVGSEAASDAKHVPTLLPTTSATAPGSCISPSRVSVTSSAVTRALLCTAAVAAAPTAAASTLSRDAIASISLRESESNAFAHAPAMTLRP